MNLDTQKAVDALQSIRNTIQSNIVGLQGQLEAIDLAMAQLNGTLTTQLIDLENKYKDQIASLTAQIEAKAEPPTNEKPI